MNHLDDTSHLDEGTLQSWLDGELEGEALAALSGHLEGCEACRERVRSLRHLTGRVSARLAEIDTLGDLEGAMERARRRRPVGPPVRRRWSAAAGIVLFLAAGTAAAMISGFPLRFGPFGGEPEPRTLESPSPAASISGSSGVVVQLVGGIGEVVLLDLPDGMRIEVQPGVGAGVEVMAPVGTRYLTSAGRIEVHPAPGALDPIRIQIPTGARELRILLGDRLLLRGSSGEFFLEPGVSAERVGDGLRLEGLDDTGRNER